MLAETCGAVRFVITADGLHFCYRNGLRPSARAVIRGGAAVCIGALALAGPAGAVAAMLAARIGRVLEFSPAALESLVLVVVALRTLAATASAGTRRTRLRVLLPADLPVLRGLDIPLHAALLGRIAWPGLMRQLLTGLAGAGALFGIAFVSEKQADTGVVAVVVVIALSGVVAPVALAACPLPTRARRPRLPTLIITVAAAAGAGGLAALSVTRALHLVESLGPQALWHHADFLARQAGGFLTKWGLALSGALVAGALLWYRMRRGTPQGPPSSGTPPTAPGVTGSAGWPPRYPLLAAVPLTMARGPQGTAVALRRILGAVGLVGIAMAGAGYVAPGLLVKLSGGNDQLVGGGALLAAATVTTVLCATVAGPGVLLRQLRWTWEQGYTTRSVARSHIAGLLTPVALAMAPVCGGVALLAASPVPALYGLCLAVAATAGAVLSDLVETGRQENPDGTGDVGTLGALVSVGVIGAATAPWAAPLTIASALGPLTAVGCLVLAYRLLCRKITS
ncbi:hypothetical protein ACIGW8_17745 [Streptomyces sioyaensis]|uniref:hypothetical protein n=1 Tax=Streptomyces sioyaensis TaxID=67364 RepID=UPI0037D79F22